MRRFEDVVEKDRQLEEAEGSALEMGRLRGQPLGEAEGSALEMRNWRNCV